MFIAIMRIEEDRITKFRDDIETLTDAQAHVDAHAGIEAVEVPDGTNIDLLRKVDGAWVEVAPLPSAADIKAEVERRILLLMPEHKQRNTLADGLSLALQIGTDVSQWPADKQAEVQQALTDWAEIERLRARSNALEAEGVTLAALSDDVTWAAEAAAEG